MAFTQIFAYTVYQCIFAYISNVSFFSVSICRDGGGAVKGDLAIAQNLYTLQGYRHISTK